MASQRHNRSGLSLFTFKPESNGSSKSSLKGMESTSPTNRSTENHQLSSPVNSPVLMGNDAGNAGDTANELNDDIFERSVQESCCGDFAVMHHQQPKCNKCTANRSQSCAHNSSVSLQGGLKNEDFIPPAIDATTSMLSDKDTNLDDVEMVYANRRNSSVIGLNMALGRPLCSSRKSSTYSLQLSHHQPQQAQSPISPPKLTSSKSSLSFYSYADMINSEEMQRRPSFKQSYSYSQTPFSLNKKKSHVGSIPPTCKKSGQSLLSKELSTKSPPDTASSNQPFTSQKFLILPESSDSEHYDNYFPGERKSVSSNISSRSKPSNSRLDNDNESLVSSSVGDCIRQSTTEINGN